MDDSGAIYICGTYSDAAINFGSISLPNGDSTNAFIAKLIPPFNTSVNKMSVANGIVAYPVPTHSALHIIMNGDGYSDLNISDITGKEIIRYTCNPIEINAALSVNTGNIPPGAYLVQALQNGHAVTKKIIIQ
jgi:hypothetical protein